MGDDMEHKVRQLQPYELAALEQVHSNPENVSHLLTDVDVLSGRLYRQLVDWHTQFPNKPSLQDSNAFWSQLKELRSAQFEVENLRKALDEQAKKAQTLGVQLEHADDTIKHIEKAFSSYLDRLHER